MDELTPQEQASPPPATAVPTSDEKNWAMFCHLSALAGYLVPVVPLTNIIGPLIIWSVQKDKSPFVDAQGKNALNFQISMTIWTVISIVLCFVCIGIPMLIALTVVDIICVIIAAVSASNGTTFNYPLTIRFIK